MQALIDTATAALLALVAIFSGWASQLDALAARVAALPKPSAPADFTAFNAAMAELQSIPDGFNTALASLDAAIAALEA